MTSKTEIYKSLFELLNFVFGSLWRSIFVFFFIFIFMSSVDNDILGTLSYINYSVLLRLSLIYTILICGQVKFQQF